MRHPGPLAIAALLASVQSTTAAPSASTKSACKEIAAAIPGRVSYPLSIPYIKETQSYWSTALRELQPACLVLPESVEEVSVTIKVLNKYPDVKFAAKSGGHDPNPGHGSVHEGVLIATRKMTGTTYDKDTNLAYVQPGGEWNDAIGALDKQGVTVVGGRLGMLQIIMSNRENADFLCRYSRYRRILAARRHFLPKCPIRSCCRRKLFNCRFRLPRDPNIFHRVSWDGKPSCQTELSPI